jgi:selenocysteine lyase/cysteine desulfurase
MYTRRQFLGAFGPTAAMLATASFDPAAWARVLDGLVQATGTPAEVARDEAFWRPVQQAFTVDRSLVHLNNGGVCPAPAMVQHALADHQQYAYKVPFYVHRRTLRPQVDHVRRRLAETFGCDAEELALTRNTSEGMEICQLGIDLEPGDEVLTTEHDYPRMVRTWRQRVQREGIVLRQFPLPVPAEDPAGVVALFEDNITTRTRLIMLCHMIDLTGQILPVRDVVAMARRHGIPVLVDGAQTFGHLAFTLDDLGCDYYATSLHKWLMGPPGTGMLFVRRDRIPDLWPLMPPEETPDDDIRKFEDVGTQSWAGVLAVAEALTFHHGIGAARKEARLRYLRDYWVHRLLVHDRVRLHTSLKPSCSCCLTTVEVDGIDSQALRDYLWEQHRIIVRPIHHPAVRGIRVSPSLYTTLDELDRFVEVMESVIRHGLPAHG